MRTFFVETNEAALKNLVSKQMAFCKGLQALYLSNTSFKCIYWSPNETPLSIFLFVLSVFPNIGSNSLPGMTIGPNLKEAITAVHFALIHFNMRICIMYTTSVLISIIGPTDYIFFIYIYIYTATSHRSWLDHVYTLFRSEFSFYHRARWWCYVCVCGLYWWLKPIIFMCFFNLFVTMSIPL